MSNNNEGPKDESQLSRRRALTALGTGAGTLVGLGAFSTPAAAWGRITVDFKGCSELWIVVSEKDTQFDPPSVAHVIVETEDGTLDCRVQEFTPETTTTIPGQYGSAPLLKYAPPSEEKVLGVIMYNYDSADRFGRNSPLIPNLNRCAYTPGTPDIMDAPCAENTYLSTTYIQDGPRNRGRGRGTDGDEAGDSDEDYSRGKSKDDDSGQSEGERKEKSDQGDSGRSENEGNGRAEGEGTGRSKGKGRGKGNSRGPP